ncbi:MULTISPECIES: putative lipid II flippase FtsW [Aeromicrobium]|uniref:Probable peptidoglycan glycosyltransferase FtsW n=1 Tax=Aeromicrobium yanjiei TaxID=2662028 RepID=A0A5Q2MJ98_9ACTN|nr:MULTISPECIES: putative lipid II flippase FtsW [Aeromicrobium]MRK02166.1 putative lipid II flippase FtsW [Aeromicrobium sp. S22]QGG41112.1 putative lipid II flippase FtsW [Aeromicrobium yanjiei]
MSTTEDRRTPAIVEAARRTLERPLASYQLVLGATTLLLGLGLIMVLSASSIFALVNYGNSFSIVLRQMIFAVLGVIGAIIVSRMPLATLRRFITPFLVVSVLLVMATFVPGVGLERNGNRNWLPLFGGFQLQPSEFAKLALVLWIADIYARRQKYLNIPRYVITPMVPVAGSVALLVVGQHDLGTALVLFALIIGMLWVAGLPRKQMGALLAMLFVGLVLAVAQSPHRVQRLLNFTNPEADPDSAGFQAIHGMMALARGGFWGVGLGGSRQKWGSLPEAHTDFILAVIGEEIGLVGALVVLVLFIVLGFAGLRIATRTREPFVRYTAAGITIWIMIQAVINIGMVLGMLPVIGIPLPLISYGGSSLLVTLVALGILLNCAKSEPGARRALEAGRANRKKRK